MMKKLVTATLLILVLFYVKTTAVSAATSCPTSSIQCGELDAGGGCTSPCLRVVLSVGGKGPSWCSCQQPSGTTPGSVSCGGSCQTSADCAASCSFCRARGTGTGYVCLKGTVDEFENPTNLNDTNSDPTCSNGNGIDTAIGCIPVSDTNGFLGWILRWAIGVGGGIAFLLIVYASIMVMTSQGVPDRLKAGQELLTSAISGLIMLIFSVYILKFIGIDILRLGSFGFGQ